MHKTENSNLKKQLKKETTEKVCPTLKQLQFILGFLLKQNVLYFKRDWSFFE